MKRLTIRLLIALLTFTAGVGAATGWLHFRDSSPPEITPRPAHRPVSRDAGEPTLPGWGRVFFPYIDKHTSLVPLPTLRLTALAPGDLEIRVWHVISFEPLEGLVLKRSSGQWSALHLKGDDGHEPRKVKQRELRPPLSGWEACWQKLVDAGLLTLPDSGEIDYDVGGPDGWGYVVEVRDGNSYRAYLYQLPEYSRLAQARQMLEVGDTIGHEFRIPVFKAKKVSAK